MKSLVGPDGLECIASVKMTFNLDTVVEIVFQTIFQRDDTASLGRFGDYGDFEQAFIDKFVIVSRIFFACMEQVHLQSEQWELELASDEGEGFGCVLLAQFGCRFPTAFRERVLQVFGLNKRSATEEGLCPKMIRTMSRVISLPERNMLTHKRRRPASFLRGRSSKLLYSMASKLSRRANMAKRSASR